MADLAGTTHDPTNDLPLTTLGHLRLEEKAQLGLQGPRAKCTQRVCPDHSWPLSRLLCL